MGNATPFVAAGRRSCVFFSSPQVRTPQEPAIKNLHVCNYSRFPLNGSQQLSVHGNRARELTIGGQNASSAVRPQKSSAAIVSTHAELR